jgi:hypothetical protein
MDKYQVRRLGVGALAHGVAAGLGALVSPEMAIGATGMAHLGSQLAYDTLKQKFPTPTQRRRNAHLVDGAEKARR